MRSWVGYEDFKITRLPEVDKNTPIVVYCSVGYRSEKIGEKLRKAGYTNVTNLFGGLFTWANENRPLKKPTNQPARFTAMVERGLNIYRLRVEAVLD